MPSGEMQSVLSRTLRRGCYKKAYEMLLHRGALVQRPSVPTGLETRFQARCLLHRATRLGYHPPCGPYFTSQGFVSESAGKGVVARSCGASSHRRPRRTEPPAPSDTSARSREALASPAQACLLGHGKAAVGVSGWPKWRALSGSSVSSGSPWPSKYRPSSGSDANQHSAHQACSCPTSVAGKSIALVGSGTSAAFTARRAFQLADHAVGEARAVVDTARLNLQDRLRQKFKKLPTGLLYT